MSDHNTKSASRCAIALVLAGAISLPSAALAHEGKYVDELDIVSTETWLHDAVGGGIQDGTSAAIDKIVSDIGMSLLQSALNSYIPGLGAVLGLGTGGTDANTERILAAITSATVQLAERIDRLQDTVAAGQQVDITSDYLTGESLFDMHQSNNSVEGRIFQLGLLQQSVARLLDAMHSIESLVFVTPERLMALEFLHTHIAVAMLVGAVAAEQARLTAINTAYARAGRPAGSIDDFLLSLNATEQANLAAEISTGIRAQQQASLNSVFAFYGMVADDGIVRAESDSWFSPATDPSLCWDESKDPSFDLPQYYQNADNWSDDCCEKPAIYWSGTGDHCARTADIFWYYYANAPNAACYHNSADLYDDAEAEACNRFFMWDQQGDNHAYQMSFEDYAVSYSPAGDGLAGYNAHRDAVYDAFVARIYGPVSAMLDSLWVAIGRTGTRPRNGLDGDLDFTITNVPGLPPSNNTIARPAMFNFGQFPRYSMAMMQPMI